MAVKTADIKKHILQGSSTKYGPVGLFLNGYDGEMWATNKYWMTRAERVAPLLEQYNLSAAEPGTYEVNGAVRRANGDNHGIPMQPPDFARYMKDLLSFQPGIRVKVAGQDAFTCTDRGSLMAVYLMADGTHAGLMADKLEWLSDTLTAPLPAAEDGTYQRYGQVHVLFRRPEAGGVEAMIQAEVFRVIERSRYEDGKHVPAVEEPAAPRLLGLMMCLDYHA